MIEDSHGLMHISLKQSEPIKEESSRSSDCSESSSKLWMEEMGGEYVI